tara:strand:+ start:803 stop:1141 length:339 start_codon:yes stop_codon:yes gene_type:complete
MSKGYTKQEVQEWKGWAEKRKEMSKKKTFEIQLLSHVEGETQEEAIKEFLTDIIQRKYSDICGIGKDIAIDAREVPQEEEGLFDMKAKVQADSPYNDGWIKEFYKKVDDENK